MSGSIRRDTGRQTLLIGAVVVALLAIVAVGLVGRARLGALFGHHQSETPTLMIISRQMLMTTVQTNQQVEATVLGPKAAPNAKGAQANDKSDSNDGRSAGQRQSSQFNVLISSMEDALGGLAVGVRLEDHLPGPGGGAGERMDVDEEGVVDSIEGDGLADFGVDVSG